MTSRYWTELTRRQLSRRRVLGGALAAGAGAAAVALTGACSDTKTTVDTGDGTPVRGGLHPEVDEAILDSKRTVDPEQHKEKVREAQRLIYEKGPTFLPIFTWVDFNVYHGFVRNFPNTRGLGTTGLFLSDWWLTL